MTKLSYITITARADYPTVGLPDLHLFEPTLKTLSNQTFKDFEYIVVDVFYEERKDYFKDHNYGLKIKHIPASPNIWTQHALVQTCHQFNKGIIHADGELLFFDADSSMLHPQLMENLWAHYKDGYFVSLGFGSDVTFAPEIQQAKRQQDEFYKYPKTPATQGGTSIPLGEVDVPTEWIKELGYGYQGIIVWEHRFTKLFNNPDFYKVDGVQIPPDWYYGISTASMEALLKVNGFSLAFDGDSALNDVDLGNRLVMAGYNKLWMFRNSYVVEAFAGPYWHPKMRKIRPEVKCNNGMLLYNKLSGRYRANEPLSNADIGYIIHNVCANRCPVRDTCRTLPHRAPFYNKNEPELVAYWKKYGMSETMDLEVEREIREKEGTYINV